MLIAALLPLGALEVLLGLAVLFFTTLLEIVIALGRHGFLMVEVKPRGWDRGLLKLSAASSLYEPRLAPERRPRLHGRNQSDEPYMATILDELERLGYGDVDAAPNDVELSAARSPGFVTRGFLCFYAAFASVGVGAGDVVEGGIVASIGTTLPFPIRLAEFHAAKIFGSSAAALFS